MSDAGLHAPPGLVEGVVGASLAVQATTAALLAIALANAMELLVLVFHTFQQYRGLYFWSLFISCIGIIIYAVGSILHDWDTIPLSASVSVTWIGFLALIPTQSFILYSRLYLVFYHERFLHFLLGGIIIVSIGLVVSSAISMFGSALIRGGSWNYAYSFTERFQVTGFCVQELFISTIYIWSTMKILRISPHGRSRAKKIMYELLLFNAFTIILDTAIVVVEFLNFYTIQIALKVFVYSVKLKLEIAVLGKLVAITTMRMARELDRGPQLSFTDPSHYVSDLNDGGTMVQMPAASLSVGEAEQSSPTRTMSGNAQQSNGMDHASPTGR